MNKKLQKHWIEKQMKDVKKVFAPKLDYYKEYDILSIRWLPQQKYKYSFESSNGFVFDIGENEDIIGIEIFNFKEKIK